MGRRPAGRSDGAIQTNVARLRRLLPPGVRITTGARRYRLDAPLDAARFTALLAAGDPGPALTRRLAR